MSNHRRHASASDRTFAGAGCPPTSGGTNTMAPAEPSAATEPSRPAGKRDGLAGPPHTGMSERN